MEIPKYQILFRPAASRELRRLSKEVQIRIGRRIDLLAINPYSHDSLKMAGGDGERRVRVGDYRIIYLVQDNLLIVTVTKLGHRRDIYDR